MASTRTIPVVLIALLALARAQNPCRGAAGPEPADLAREMTLDHRYLNVPVKAGALRRTISVLVDGRVVRAFEVELADGQPDFWAFTDLGTWRGHPATIRLDPVGRLSDEKSQSASRARPPRPNALAALRLPRSSTSRKSNPSGGDLQIRQPFFLAVLATLNLVIASFPNRLG